MKKDKIGLMLFWVIVAIFTYVQSALAVDSEISRESLRGLNGVAVIIEGLGEKTPQGGASADVIRADIEERLQRAGITVLSEEQLIKEQGQPSLYATVDHLKVESLTISNVYLGLHQGVLPIRNMNTPLMLDTWSVSALVTGGNLIREALKNSTDKFIEAFLSMNPR